MLWALSLVLWICPSVSLAEQFPKTGHVTYNSAPFGAGASYTMHQVYAASMFSTATGGQPATISKIAFSPQQSGTYKGNVTINFGYTSATPGVDQASGGLALPSGPAGGSPNASGPMSSFYANANHVAVISPGNVGIDYFDEVVFPGSFVYDPSLGNLLLEIVTTNPADSLNLFVSRSSEGPDASRSYIGTGGIVQPLGGPLNTDFTYTVPEPASVGVLALAAPALLLRRRRP